jgi:hypothetical protein
MLNKTSAWADAIQEATESADLRKICDEMALKLGLYESVKTVSPHEIPVYHPTGGSATAIAMLSDTHFEERVDPKDVPGAYNVYTPAIATKRAEQFAQRVVLLVQSQRHLTKIDDLVLAILGDLITGFIHEDNVASNWMPPLEAIMFALKLVNGIIKHLLDHGDFKRIIIPCVFGNHGRTTRKPAAKMAATTNLEWMLYHLLARDWKDEPRIHFHIAEGLLVYLQVGKFTIRCMHGDRIAFQGGILGLSVPVIKAVMKMNQTKYADLTLMGHYHSAYDFGNVIVNGSMIGYNAYSVALNIPFERPRQQFILLDQKRGKSLVADIWCDYLPERKHS